MSQFKLTAKFNTPAEATAARPVIEAFLTETEKAYTWWQEHRNWNRIGRRYDFWTEFKVQFPHTLDFLIKYADLVPESALHVVDVSTFAGAVMRMTDCSGNVAGKISLTDGRVNGEYTVQRGREIVHEAEVWRGANWDPFAEWVSVECGAKSVGWAIAEPLRQGIFLPK